ncbi:sulfatase-like hydrolase/transferase [Natronosalvus caseinilyticus]|uniref:sulfatase-like hydrolase/transferase n=1 Tax=Natronosalvus caseinilyticus TaxID=2953747 RepID=UPI0028A723B8|nr:sulfatase-like hydrolase/transferase [Natronosalvus caseinilyticus]
MISRALGELTDVPEYENVLVFISDSLRYDALPDRIRSKGVTGKTIAAAPWTASSIPSLVTGKYPSTHNVWMFEDRLSDRPILLSEPDDWTAGFNSEKHWLKFDSAEKPPIKMLRLNGEQRLSELEPPFVHVIHDLGPHAPYGFENDEYDTESFFEDYSDPEELKRRYHEDTEKSARYFERVLDELDSEGSLEDTLCVFTSDHGELLGEGGRLGGKWGHSTPLCPELLEVPMTFIGAGLPEGEKLNGLVSGVDLAPTCLSAVGRPTGNVDGIDLWTETPNEDRFVRSDVWQRYDALDRTWPVYVASSLWDNEGGWVKHRRSNLLRMAYYGYDVFLGDYAPPARKTAGIRDIISGFQYWGRRWSSFGNPNISQDVADQELADDLVENEESEEFSEEQAEHLEALGYL